ncbi:TetR/AcrR family transcriptional regulator [uncultured Pseudoflavonifractor sp.]|uniref:TetR/AcrR family transcriptional regulator n=1 Tax=uncultured Pseudoflavonifractor sp. TaxID=1221379 RepID=UPI0025EEDE59|nr:TetR/AcrR family transcriptional regulator [uncultured Pseudoflavonifractor sp.]
MKTTKELIRNTARELFNERGYRAVSMRNIADALGISVGNLTYHYPHKELLMEAIMDAELDTMPAPPEPGLSGLNHLLKQMLRSFFETPFYFNDPALYSSLPRLQERHAASVMSLSQVLQDTISACTELGLFVSELSGSLLDHMTRLLMLSHIGWAQHNATWPSLHFIPVDEIMKAQWSALYPYLTPAGRAEYAVLEQLPAEQL